jgi:hypothetical protein
MGKFILVGILVLVGTRVRVAVGGMGVSVGGESVSVGRIGVSLGNGGWVSLGCIGGSVWATTSSGGLAQAEKISVRITRIKLMALVFIKDPPYRMGP